MVQSPVILSEVARLRSDIEGLLRSAGIDFREQDGDLKCTPVRWRLLGGILQAAQDPDDATALGEFAAGVNLGVTERLQRTRAVFLPRRKWKIAGQAEGDSRQHQTNLHRNMSMPSDEFWKRIWFRRRVVRQLAPGSQTSTGLPSISRASHGSYWTGHWRGAPNLPSRLLRERQPQGQE